MRIAVLASGSGTLLEAILADGIPIALVVADRPSRALEVAAAHGVAAQLVERTSYGADFDRAAYTRAVVDVLLAADIDRTDGGRGTRLGSPSHVLMGDPCATLLHTSIASVSSSRGRRPR